MLRLCIDHLLPERAAPPDGPEAAPAAHDEPTRSAPAPVRRRSIRPLTITTSLKALCEF